MRRLITVLTCSLLLFGCAENSQNALKSKDKSIRIELVDNSDIPAIYRVVDNVPVTVQEEVMLVEVKRDLTSSEKFYIWVGELTMFLLILGGYAYLYYSMMKWANKEK